MWDWLKDAFQSGGLGLTARALESPENMAEYEAMPGWKNPNTWSSILGSLGAAFSGPDTLGADIGNWASGTALSNMKRLAGQKAQWKQDDERKMFMDLLTRALGGENVFTATPKQGRSSVLFDDKGITFKTRPYADEPVDGIQREQDIRGNLQGRGTYEPQIGGNFNPNAGKIDWGLALGPQEAAASGSSGEAGGARVSLNPMIAALASSPTGGPYGLYAGAPPEAIDQERALMTTVGQAGMENLFKGFDLASNIPYKQALTDYARSQIPTPGERGVASLKSMIDLLNTNEQMIGRQLDNWRKEYDRLAGVPGIEAQQKRQTLRNAIEDGEAKMLANRRETLLQAMHEPYFSVRAKQLGTEKTKGELAAQPYELEKLLVEIDNLRDKNVRPTQDLQYRLKTAVLPNIIANKDKETSKLLADYYNTMAGGDAIFVWDKDDGELKVIRISSKEELTEKFGRTPEPWELYQFSRKIPGGYDAVLKMFGLWDTREKIPEDFLDKFMKGVWATGGYMR